MPLVRSPAKMFIVIVNSTDACVQMPSPVQQPGLFSLRATGRQRCLCERQDDVTTVSQFLS